MFKALLEGTLDGTFIIALGASFKRLAIGYTIALLLGSILGIFIATFRLVEDTLGSLVLALQSVPSIVWLPLALLWFQGGEASIIFVVALGGTLPMTINATAGIKNVQPIFLRAAKTMGVQGVSLFWKVSIPAALPYFITGLRLAWAFAWRALMAGELIGTGTGLGQILMFGRAMGSMEMVIAVMVIIAMIGSIMDQMVFRKLEDKVLTRWGLQKG